MSTADRMAFRKTLILLEDGTPFGQKVEPWQEADFRAWDSGQFRHRYLERPRGHSKTGDAGTDIVTDMALGPPGLQIFGAATDRDQAKLLLDDVAGKFQRHPALRSLVKILESEVVMTAARGGRTWGHPSRFKILSADAPSAYGLRPDRVYVDELAEWPRRELWDSLWSATGKRPDCRVTVIGTAGWDKTSIAWEVRQIAETEPDWYFASRGQCASWIRPEWLAQQRRTLPAHVFARLHECRWVDGVGAWLSAEQVDRIFGDVPDGDGETAIGMDLGISRDRAVIAVVQRVGLLVVGRAFQTYTPTRWRRVDLGEVEQDVEALATQYRCPVVYDPFQAIGMAQRLTARGVKMVEYSFSGDGRRKLFGRLLDLVTTGQLRTQPHEAFRRELLGLEARESASGAWRVDHRVGQHDDHVVAVALAVAGLPLNRDWATQPILAGRPLAVALARQRESGQEMVIESWQERSIRAEAARSQGPGGAGRGGLVI